MTAAGSRRAWLSIRVVLSLLCPLVARQLPAQNPTPPDSAAFTLRVIRALLDTNTEATRLLARRIADSAIQDRRHRHDRLNEAEALVLFGNTYYNEAVKLDTHANARFAALDSAAKAYRESRSLAVAVKLPRLVGKMDWYLGDVDRQRGKTAAAISAYRRALIPLRAAHDTTAEAAVLRTLVATYASAGGQTLGGADSARRFLGIEQRGSGLSNRRQIADRLYVLGDAEESAERARDAISDWRAALELVPEDSLLPRTTVILQRLGALLYNEPGIIPAGIDSALLYFDRAGYLARLAGRKEEQVRRLVDVADAYHKKRDRQKARAGYSAALLTADSIAKPGIRAYVRRNFADLLSDWSENEAAAMTYREAIGLATAAADTDEILSARRGLADVLDEMGYQDSSAVHYRRLLPLVEARADTDLLGSTVLAIGSRLRALDSLPEAMRHYRRALDIALATHDAVTMVPALTGIADILDRDNATRDSANKVYWRIDTVARQDGLYPQYASNLIDLAYIARRANDKATARQRVRVADSVAIATTAWSTASRAEGALAAWYDDDGMLDSAIIWRERSVESSLRAADHKGAANMQRMVGDLFYRLRRADSAMHYYRQSVATAGTVEWGLLDLSLVYSMALVYSRLGLPDSALAFGERALAARRARKDRLGEAQVLRYLAIEYSSLGRMNRAVAFSREAYGLAVKLDAKDEQAALLNNLGWELAQLGRFEEALPLLHRAVSAAEALHDTALTYHSLHSLGFVLERAGEKDSAMSRYARALELRRAHASSGLAARLDLAIGLNYLADIIARTDPDSALAMFREAAALARDARDDAVAAEALRGIGATLAARQRPGDLASAVAYFDSAATVFSFVRGRSGEDLNRVSYAEHALRLYEEWTLAWLSRAKEVGEENAALAALAAAARGEAQALLDLRRGSPDSTQGANLVVEGRRLVARVTAQHSTALVYFTATDRLIVWSIDDRGRLRAHSVPIARAALDSLVFDYRRALGLSSANISARLASREVVLDAPDERELPAATSRRSVGDDDEGFPAAARDSIGRRLRQLVVPDAVWKSVRAGSELIIVPQGALSLVPFAALPVDDREHYLGLRQPVRYTPALAALSDSLRRSSERDPVSLQGALVVGNPTMPTVRDTAGRIVRLLPLSAAEAEARMIAARLGTRPLIGAAATQGAVEARLSQASIIHLATHGFAFTGEERARDSFIALAPDSTHSGLLTVAQIADSVRLNADLVVLSACQTGLGNLKLAEGTIGFQRALLAKGARYVLVSLWSVADSATSVLMQRFYGHWLDDDDRPSKATALMRAEQDLVRTGIADPRYWAAFQLVGG